MKRLTILGSTGSIGTQTIDVIASRPGEFKVVALAAGRNVTRLADQAQTAPAGAGRRPGDAEAREVVPAPSRGHARGVPAATD